MESLESERDFAIRASRAKGENLFPSAPIAHPTPAWAVGGTYGAGGLEIVERDPTGGPSRLVAVAKGSTSGGQLAALIARADLIAAAPDLLAACKAALRELDDLHREGARPSLAIIAQLEAANTKAEGRSAR